MVFVPALNVAEVAMRYTINNRPIVNVLYFRKSTALTLADLTTLATLVRDWWQNTMRANFSIDIRLGVVSVRDLTVQNGLIYDLVIASPIGGTRAGNPASNQVAIVTSNRTGLAGRSYRGRNFWASIVENDVTTEFLETTLCTNVGNAMVALRTSVVAAGFDWVVVSRVLNGVARVTALISDIISVIVNTRVDTQRRRVRAS